MRARRRLDIIHGVGSEVKETQRRYGVTYHLAWAELNRRIPGTVRAIYTIPGIPAFPSRRKRRVDAGT